MDERNAHPIEKILCATDFSETAELALRYAASLARLHHAELILAHAVEATPMDPYPMPMALPENDGSVTALAFERLQDRAKGLAGSGLSIETCLETGPPGPLLVEMANEKGVDLIVVGTRGWTGLKHLVFGSTAEHIVRCASCPVLTVHPNDQEPTETLREVILATDLSPDAEAAVEAMIRLFPGGSPPRVVVAFADAAPPYLEALQVEGLNEWQRPDARIQDLERQLEPILERLRERAIASEVRILDRGAAPAIVDLAEERGSDLIVMSTHGRSAIVNVLLGRTAQRVVQHATCPVLTVRPPTRS